MTEACARDRNPNPPLAPMSAPTAVPLMVAIEKVEVPTMLNVMLPASNLKLPDVRLVSVAFQATLTAPSGGVPNVSVTSMSARSTSTEAALVVMRSAFFGRIPVMEPNPLGPETLTLIVSTNPPYPFSRVTVTLVVVPSASVTFALAKRLFV